ncbi:MAG: hypothetical protein IK116_07065 [Firmicutes bacterium]|nr:hypothetical protein [Bacillota bacterium]
MKHDKLLILPLLLLIALLIALPLLNPGGVLWQSVAAGEGNDTQVIATINGEDFVVPSLEQRLAVYAQQGRPQEGEALKKRLVERQLFYREACAAGCAVDDETLDAYLNDLRQSLPQDPETYAMFQDELATLGLTEEEYWRDYRQEYRELMVNGLYYRQLEREYWHSDQAAAAGNQPFDEYYSIVYLPQLFDKYQVVLK